MFSHLSAEIEALGVKVRNYLAGSGDAMAAEFHSAVVKLHQAGLNIESRIEAIEKELGIEHTPPATASGDVNVQTAPGIQSGGSETVPATGDPQPGSGAGIGSTQSESGSQSSEPAP